MTLPVISYKEPVTTRTAAEMNEKDMNGRGVGLEVKGRDEVIDPALTSSLRSSLP